MKNAKVDNATANLVKAIIDSRPPVSDRELFEIGEAVRLASGINRSNNYAEERERQFVAGLI